MRRNHDGKALNGSSRASLPVGSGSVRSCANAGAEPAARSFLWRSATPGPHYAGEKRLDAPAYLETEHAARSAGR
jgi:hypothetical protein